MKVAEGRAEELNDLREVRIVLLELGLQNPESAIDASNPRLKQLAETPLD
jgi:hypothetical protein